MTDRMRTDALTSMEARTLPARRRRRSPDRLPPLRPACRAGPWCVKVPPGRRDLPGACFVLSPPFRQDEPDSLSVLDILAKVDHVLLGVRLVTQTVVDVVRPEEQAKLGDGGSGSYQPHAAVI